MMNELTLEGEDRIAFDSDCTDGACGMYGVMIDGPAHGRLQNHQLPESQRVFNDGAAITVEP